MSRRVSVRSKKPKLGTVNLKNAYQDDAEESNSEIKNKGNFICKKCGQQFTLSSNYRRHTLHNKICGSRKEGFECSNCHKVFSLKATLKDHYLRCTAEDPYRFNCPHCPKLFTFKSSLNKHIRGRCKYAKKSGKERNYKCSYCNVEFYSLSASRKHVNEGICTFDNIPQRYVCPHCANRFTLKSSLTKHLKGRCKAMKQLSEEEIPKYEIVINTSQANDDENITPFQIITGDVIEECPEWDTYETENVESYIEIEHEDEGDDDYVFIKVNS